MKQPKDFLLCEVTERAARVLRWLYVAVSAVLIFVLPYCFPPQKLTNSFSYDFGFNNKISILAAILCILLAPVFLGRGRKWTPVSTDFTQKQASRVSLVLVFFFHTIGLAYLFFFTLMDSGTPDGPYFFMHAVSMKLHLRPYVDFEYAYGPALLYPTHWFNVLGLSIHAAYFTYYAGLTFVGIYVAWSFTNLLPVHQTAKTVAFSLLASISLVVTVDSGGINYVLLRFLLPLWTLLLLDDARAKRKGVFREFWIACIGILLTDSISPEMGLVLAVTAACFFALTSYFDSDQRIPRLACLGACLSIHIAIFFVLPQQFRDSMRAFGSGGSNFPIVPSLTDAIYLVCFAYCVRRYSANLRERSLAIPLLLLFSLGSLPGALSHADIGHVELYGLGVYMATIAAAQSEKPKLLWLYALLPACLLYICDTHAPHREKFRLATTSFLALCDKAGAEQIVERTGRILHFSSNHPVEILRHRRAQFDAHWEMIDKQAAFASRFSSSAEFALPHYEVPEYLSTKNFKPRYYFTTTNVFDPETVTLEIDNLKKLNPEILLAPRFAENPGCPSESEEQDILSRWLLYPYYVSRKHNSCEIYNPYFRYLRDYRPASDLPDIWIRDDLVVTEQ